MQVLHLSISRSLLPLQYLPQPARFKNKYRQLCTTINTEPKQIGIKLWLKHSQGVCHTLQLTLESVSALTYTFEMGQMCQCTPVQAQHLALWTNYRVYQ